MLYIIYIDTDISKSFILLTSVIKVVSLDGEGQHSLDQAGPVESNNHLTLGEP